MVKTKGPALSADAAGTLADVLTFQSNHRRQTAKLHSKPKRSPTPKQHQIREMNKFLSSEWKNLTKPERLTWAQLAYLRRLSPYHAYLSANMHRWANFHAPSKQYPASETGPVPFTARPNLYGAYHHYQGKSFLGLAPNVWGWIWYARPGTGTWTPSPEDLQTIKLHVWTGARQLWYEFDLAPGWYSGCMQTFSSTGLLSAPSPKRSVLVT